MNDLLRKFIYEIIVAEGNKPPKNILKGKTYECVVKKTASKKLKKAIKNNNSNNKTVMVKMIEPDGRGDFSIVEFNKKKYMVKTSSLK